MEGQLLNSFEQLSQTYYVDNINLQKAKYIFILESPHIQEIKYKVPVAGPSGKMMTKFLFDRSLDEPLGRLLREAQEGRAKRSKLLEIGLLNVCNIPMQAAAYRPEDRERHRDLIAVLEELRVKYQSKSYKYQEWNEVRDVLTNRFQNQLELLRMKECFIIPCGRFAATYFERTGVTSENWSVIEGVPHPSRNQWYNDYEGLNRLKHIFEGDGFIDQSHRV